MVDFSKIADNIRGPHIFRDFAAFFIPGCSFFIIGYYLEDQSIKNATKLTQFDAITNLTILFVSSYALGRVLYGLSGIINEIFLAFMQKRLTSYFKENFSLLFSRKVARPVAIYFEAEILEACQKNPLLGNSYERTILNNMFFITMFGVLLLAAFVYTKPLLFLLAFIFLVVSSKNIVELRDTRELIFKHNIQKNR